MQYLVSVIDDKSNPGSTDRRPAISAFGATSIASVLRLLEIDSGENTASTNFWLPSASACTATRPRWTRCRAARSS